MVKALGPSLKSASPGSRGSDGALGAADVPEADGVGITLLNVAGDIVAYVEIDVDGACKPGPTA